MRAATAPESVRKAWEVALINLVEDRHHSLLNHLVLQCCDAPRALPPIGLRYIDPSRRSCPIRSTVHPAGKIAKPILQPGFILLPCHSIHSGRGLPLQRVKAVPEQSDGQMVEQSGEPFLFPFFSCLPHTAQSLGHSFSALCRARVGRNDVLLDSRPSLPNLRGGLLPFVRLVHRYCGAIRLLRSVHVRLVAQRLRGPVSILVGPRRPGDLPVLVHIVSQRAWVLRLRRAD